MWLKAIERYFNTCFTRWKMIVKLSQNSLSFFTVQTTELELKYFFEERYGVCHVLDTKIITDRQGVSKGWEGRLGSKSFLSWSHSLSSFSPPPSLSISFPLSTSACSVSLLSAVYHLSSTFSPTVLILPQVVWTPRSPLISLLLYFPFLVFSLKGK